MIETLRTSVYVILVSGFAAACSSAGGSNARGGEWTAEVDTAGDVICRKEVDEEHAREAAKQIADGLDSAKPPSLQPDSPHLRLER